MNKEIYFSRKASYAIDEASKEMKKEILEAKTFDDVSEECKKFIEDCCKKNIKDKFLYNLLVEEG